MGGGGGACSICEELNLGGLLVKIFSEFSGFYGRWSLGTHALVYKQRVEGHPFTGAQKP